MTKGREARRSREEVEALLGKRTPLPGGARQLSPQLQGRRAAAEPSLRRRVAEDDRPGIDPQVSLDPRRVNMLREQRAGYAGGGPVAPAAKRTMRYTGQYEEEDGSVSDTYRDAAQRAWIVRPSGEVRMHPDSVEIERSKRVGAGRGRVNPPLVGEKKYAAGGAVRGNGCATKGKTRGAMR